MSGRGFTAHIVAHGVLVGDSSHICGCGVLHGGRREFLYRRRVRTGVTTRVAIGGQLRVKRRRSMVYVGKGRGCKPMSGGAIGREMRGASGTVQYWMERSLRAQLNGKRPTSGCAQGGLSKGKKFGEMTPMIRAE